MQFAEQHNPASTEVYTQHSKAKQGKVQSNFDFDRIVVNHIWCVVNTRCGVFDSGVCFGVCQGEAADSIILVGNCCL